MSRFRAMLVAIATLAILATTRLTPVPAVARPTPPGTQVQFPNITVPSSVTLSSTEWKAAKKARDARNKAISANGAVMDYRKMKTVFGTKNRMQVDWRHQMAAGYRQAGGRITHISKAENKNVEKRRKKIYGKKKPKGSVAGSKVKAYSSCHGSSATVVDGDDTFQFLNSCETIDLLYSWGGCVAIMGGVGFVAGADKRVSWPAYAIGAFCGYWATNIERAKEKSDDGAIIVETHKAEAYQPYPSGVRYYIRTTVLPQ